MPKCGSGKAADDKKTKSKTLQTSVKRLIKKGKESKRANAPKSIETEESGDSFLAKNNNAEEVYAALKDYCREDGSVLSVEVEKQKLKTDIDNHTRRLAELEREKEDEIKELRTTLENQRRSFNALEEKCTDLEKSFKYKEDEFNKLQIAYRDEKAARERAEDENAELTKVNKNISDKLANAEIDIDVLNSKNKGLKDENNNLIEVTRSKSIQLATAEETINKLRTDITQLEKEAARNEQDIKTATADSGMKEIEISKLQSYIQRLQQAISEKDEHMQVQFQDITRLGQTLAQTEAASSALKKKSDEEVARLRKTNDHLQNTVVAERKAKEDGLNKLGQTLAQAEEAYSELKRRSYDEVARLRNTIDHLQSTVVSERKAKEDALTRLSAAAANKLRDKNPGITDLSDPNRPLKLSEKISELYDNEWTNAMEKLEDEGLDEDGAVVVLLRIFTTLFSKFKEAGEKHLASIPKMIVVPDIDDNEDKTDDKTKIPHLPTEIMKPIKDFRKAHAEKAIERLKKKTASFLENDDQTEKVLRACNEYLASCTEICWLMCVQDPPVHMRWDFKPNDDFDTNIMRSYTKSGKFVSYVVWPVLYLHEGGPLLAKGVVQGRKTKVEAPKPAKNDDGEGKSPDENHEQSPPDVKSSDGKDTTDSELRNVSEERGHADDAEKTKTDDSISDPGSNESKIGNGYGIQEGGKSDQLPTSIPGDTATFNDDHNNVRDERSKSIESNKSEEDKYYDTTDHMPHHTENQDDERDQEPPDDTENNEDNGLSSPSSTETTNPVLLD